MNYSIVISCIIVGLVVLYVIISVIMYARREKGGGREEIEDADEEIETAIDTKQDIISEIVQRKTSADKSKWKMFG